MMCYCHFCFNVCCSPHCPFGNDTKEKDHSTFCVEWTPTIAQSIDAYHIRRCFSPPHFLVEDVWCFFMYDVRKDHVTTWIKSTFLCFVIQNKKNPPTKKKVELRSVGRVSAFSIKSFAFNENTAWIANQMQFSRKISLKCASHKRQVFTQQYCLWCSPSWFFPANALHSLKYEAVAKLWISKPTNEVPIFPKIDDIHPSGMKLWLSKVIRHLKKWISLKINTFWFELCRIISVVAFRVFMSYDHIVPCRKFKMCGNHPDEQISIDMKKQNKSSIIMKWVYCPYFCLRFDQRTSL